MDEGRAREAARNGRRKVLRQMERLAESRVNDAVKLAFLGQDQLEMIDELDLAALAEFKRSGNGTVEIRLVDRLAVLEKLLERLEDREDSAERFFRALGGQEREE